MPDEAVKGTVDLNYNSERVRALFVSKLNQTRKPYRRRQAHVYLARAVGHNLEQKHQEEERNVLEHSHAGLIGLLHLTEPFFVLGESGQDVFCGEGLWICRQRRGFWG